jgi:flavin reductase (DIM6/NTAB) family NADH-FMN oxidoreductase RutF
MSKIKLGAQVLAYPMPAFLVGANVDGKPNLTTVAWGGIANGEPPMVAIALRHPRHTNKGIRQNRTFSVNIPSADLVKETDYCGIISGSKVNKLDACKFTVFYGKLGTAPLIVPGEPGMPDGTYAGPGHSRSYRRADRRDIYN